MIHIEQFRYGDNLAYLLYGKTEAMAIDGGAWQEILSFLERHTLSLRYVANTHRHYDHTPGDDHLLAKTNAAFLDCRTLADQERFLLDGEPVVVYRTPGHSEDSICFHAGNDLITGDTLFNAGAGNVHYGGSVDELYTTFVQQLAKLPENTRVYPGHDYIENNLRFTLAREVERPRRLARDVRLRSRLRQTTC